MNLSRQFDGTDINPKYLIPQAPGKISTGDESNPILTISPVLWYPEEKYENENPIRLNAQFQKYPWYNVQN